LLRYGERMVYSKIFTLVVDKPTVLTSATDPRMMYQVPI
jgi:hypothetical protein